MYIYVYFKFRRCHFDRKHVAARQTRTHDLWDPFAIPEPAFSPSWELPLHIAPPNGPMERMMVGTIQQQGSLVLGGTTGTALTGPYQPSLKPLCCPDLSNSTC
jgi:hypothetical protein